MITGVIKNKIDKIWTDIWAGGITNPLTVIEQLTYLMFIRSLDEKELETEEFANSMGTQPDSNDLIFPQSEIGQAMRWSKFKDRDSREIFDLISQRVFPAVKKMKYGKLPDFDASGELIEIDDREDAEQVQTAFSRYMDSAVFVIPNPQVLQKIITGLDDLHRLVRGGQFLLVQRLKISKSHVLFLPVLSYPFRRRLNFLIVNFTTMQPAGKLTKPTRISGNACAKMNRSGMDIIRSTPLPPPT